MNNIGESVQFFLQGFCFVLPFTRLFKEENPDGKQSEDYHKVEK
jgi:hypothetical protein